MSKWRYAAAAAIAGVLAVTMPVAAVAEPLKVLSAGAFKQVLLGVIPQFEKDGRDVQLESDTVGGLVRRIEAGESFDLVVASPAALDTLKKAGKVADSIVSLARVGVGVGVKEGTERPDIGSVEAFKQALLRARAVT
jgi:molybdate transport system substrate-binding protein